MMTNLGPLTDEELLRVLRCDQHPPVVEELCKRLAAALDKIKKLENEIDNP